MTKDCLNFVNLQQEKKGDTREVRIIYPKQIIDVEFQRPVIENYEIVRHSKLPTFRRAN